MSKRNNNNNDLKSLKNSSLLQTRLNLFLGFTPDASCFFLKKHFIYFFFKQQQIASTLRWVLRLQHLRSRLSLCKWRRRESRTLQIGFSIKTRHNKYSPSPVQLENGSISHASPLIKPKWPPIPCLIALTVFFFFVCVLLFFSLLPAQSIVNIPSPKP